MKWLLAALLGAALAGTAWAGEKFEDNALKVAAEAPDEFVRQAAAGKDDFIGDMKALFLSPDAQNNGGAMLIHHMSVPAGGTYEVFKGQLAAQLGLVFANGFKLIRQEDVEVGKLAGFVLEFSCPGDGGKPDPNGTIPHRIRWYLFRDGDAKIIGVLYGARDAAWAGLDARFAASAKTLRRLE